MNDEIVIGRQVKGGASDDAGKSENQITVYVRIVGIKAVVTKMYLDPFGFSLY